jgi:putative ABC transport system substrate-binding protein
MALGVGRRQFISALGGAAVAWPIAARAQQSAMPVIGYLHGGAAASFAQQLTAYREGLRGAGYVEGQNVAIEYRWAEENLRALADELVSRHVTVIAAFGGDIVARAAMKSTSAIPIVFLVGQDVIRSGLVVSFNRPGGNVTGVSVFVPILVPKQMELVRTIVPSATMIAVLTNPNNPTVLPDPPDLEKAAHANGMELLLLNATTTEEIDVAFVAATDRRAGALLVPGEVFFNKPAGPNRLVSDAARHPCDLSISRICRRWRPNKLRQ